MFPGRSWACSDTGFLSSSSCLQCTVIPGGKLSGWLSLLLVLKRGVPWHSRWSPGVILGRGIILLKGTQLWDCCTGLVHTHLLLERVHSTGIASETSEHMMERSRLRAWHCLQHKQGAEATGKVSSSSPSSPLCCRAVLRPCPTMGRRSFTMMGPERRRRSLSLFQAPWGNLSSDPLQTPRKETLQPPPATRWSPTFLSTAITSSRHTSRQVYQHWHFRHGLKLVPEEQEGTRLKEGHRVVSQGGPTRRAGAETPVPEGQVRPRQPVPVFVCPAHENGRPATKPPCCFWGNDSAHSAHGEQTIM